MLSKPKKTQKTLWNGWRHGVHELFAGREHMTKEGYPGRLYRSQIVRKFRIHMKKSKKLLQKKHVLGASDMVAPGALFLLGLSPNSNYN